MTVFSTVSSKKLFFFSLSLSQVSEFELLHVGFALTVNQSLSGTMRIKVCRDAKISTLSFMDC